MLDFSTLFEIWWPQKVFLDLKKYIVKTYMTNSLSTISFLRTIDLENENKPLKTLLQLRDIVCWK